MPFSILWPGHDENSDLYSLSFCLCFTIQSGILPVCRIYHLISEGLSRSVSGFYTVWHFATQYQYGTTVFRVTMKTLTCMYHPQWHFASTVLLLLLLPTSTTTTTDYYYWLPLLLLPLLLLLLLLTTTTILLLVFLCLLVLFEQVMKKALTCIRPWVSQLCFSHQSITGMALLQRLSAVSYDRPSWQAQSIIIELSIMES